MFIVEMIYYFYCFFLVFENWEIRVFVGFVVEVLVGVDKIVVGFLDYIFDECGMLC